MQTAEGDLLIEMLSTADLHQTANDVVNMKYQRHKYTWQTVCLETVDKWEKASEVKQENISAIQCTVVPYAFRCNLVYASHGHEDCVNTSNIVHSGLLAEKAVCQTLGYKT